MRIRMGIALIGALGLWMACPAGQVVEQAEDDIEDDGSSTTADAGVDASVRDAGGDSDSAVERDAARPDFGLPPDADTGCPPGQLPDGEGTCRDMCRSDEDCARTDYCHESINLCLARDEATCNPAACAPGFYCPDPGSPDDPGTGECVPGTGFCVVDEDCFLGQVCEGSECVWAEDTVIDTCETDADCPFFMVCQVGVCIGCVDDIQCALENDGARCVQGVCVTADLPPAVNCLTAQCGPEERCDPATGACVPRCAVDEDCAADEVCIAVGGMCVADPTCVEDTDCGDGLRCSQALGEMGGVCVGCSAEQPCPAGLSCVLSVCLPDVTADSCDNIECAADELCDPREGVCYPADGRCEDDTSCRGEMTCNFLGLCSGCAGDSDCWPEMSCVLGTCVTF